MAELVFPAYPVFTDVDGNPLEDGFIFIGVFGQDPEVSPLQAYWDEGLTTPANNIRTKGGYPLNGTVPGRLFTATKFSLVVKNKRNVIVYARIDSVTTTADASDVSIVDSGGYYDSSDVEGALQEIGPRIASYVFLVDTDSADVTMTPSDTWVVGDGFAGPNYPSVNNPVLNSGDIVSFENIGTSGNVVKDLPDGMELIDGDKSNYQFYNASYGNMAEVPRTLRVELAGQPAIAGTGVFKALYKIEDTHDAYNLSTGVFTAPIDGIYLFTNKIYLNANLEVFVGKNGTQDFNGYSLVYAALPRTTIGWGLAVFTIRLEKDDYIDYFRNTAEGQPATDQTYITIERIGN